MNATSLCAILRRCICGLTVLLGLAALTACSTVQPPPRVEPVATRTTYFDYDATGLLVREAVEPGNSDLCVVKVHERDAWGNISRTTTRNCDGSPGEAPPPADGSPARFEPHSASTVYDARGQFPATLTNALNHVETRAYDPRFGGATAIIDANQLQTVSAYDEFGRKVTEQPPVGPPTTWQYEDCRDPACTYRYRIFESTGGATPEVRREYDKLDREIAGEAARLDGASWSRAENRYDARGRRAASTRRFAAGDLAERDAVTTVYEYDLLDRVVRVTAPEARVTTMEYAGLTTRVIDPRTYPRTTVRTLGGQVQSTTDAAGTVVSFAYDPFDNLVVADAGGIVTSAVYDVRGRKVQTTDADMGTWTYVYDALGQLVQQTSARQHVVTTSYDLLGRPLQRTEADLVSTWQYDAAPAECPDSKSVGRLARAETAAGYVRVECHDVYGRPSQQRVTQDGETFVTATEYDALSRPGRLTYPSGYQVDHGYLNGYLQNIVDATNGVQVWRIDAMDANAQITAETAGNVTATTRSYDYAGRVTSIIAGGGTVHSFGIGYDPADNVLTRNWTIDGVTRSETFTYDALNRLTDVAGADGPPPRQYGYDAVGNLLSKSDVGAYAYVPGTRRLQSITGSLNGVVDPVFEHDANGNLVSGAGYAIGWTSFDRPLTVGKPEAATSSFVYGPEHQRIQHSDGTVVTVYVGAYERDVAGDGAVVHKHFIRAGGRLIAEYRMASASGNTLQLFHDDHLGSVAALTAADGTVIARFGYDPWGLRRNADGSEAVITTAATDRGYTGHEMLDGLRLVHMNARVYDPQLGRFLSADSIVPDPGSALGFNRYAYVYNNPLTLLDPSGMKPFWRKESFRKYGLPVIAIAASWAVIQFMPALISELAALAGAATEGASFVLASKVITGAAGGFTGGVIASGGDLKAGAMGALTGGAFAYVGTLGLEASLLGHSVVGCGSAALQGGNCVRGAVSQLVSKSVTLAGVDLGLGAVGRFVAATAAGGSVSAITGGKFANGAYTAAFGYLFNELSKSSKNQGIPISDSERQLAAAGDAEGFWESRQTQGDPLARIALGSLSAAGDLFDALFGGMQINSRLVAFSRVYSGVEIDIEQVRLDLMRAHVAAVDADKQGVIGKLSPGQVYDYHRDVFARYGLPTTTFGGSFLTGSRSEAYVTRFIWCRGCDW